ncbi:MAG: hypothetical protein ACOC3I_05980, partial [Verrucomicrobiota bacterium]
MRLLAPAPTRLARLGLALVVVLYGLLYLGDYLSSSLGQSPQLDARENLHLAAQLAAGELPEEPFYRAMGYPWLLSQWTNTDGSWADEARLAAIVGLACHWLNVVLVGWCAWRIWGTLWGAWAAGTLYGLYPVALFFSTQVLDVTLGLTLFLVGLAVFLMRPQTTPDRAARWVLVGLLWGFATIVRPHFLFVALGGLVLAALGGRSRLQAFQQAGLLAGGLAVPILLQAVAGAIHGGQFHPLPWQGAYNLYAANREGANGKYFTQRVVVEGRDEGLNPARAESEILYQRATGAESPLDPKAMSAYWRGQFLREIAQDPLDWLGLLGRKAFYVFHHHEQYNNLTYDFHKARSPLLAWNPLGWGGLLLLGAVGFAAHWRTSSDARQVLLLAAAYSVSLLLFYASARFRLPLVPLLCILAAGLARVPEWGLTSPGKRPGAFLALVAGVSFLAYAPLFEANDRSTHLQDMLLVSNAAAEVGRDAEALHYATTALAVAPERPDARRLALVSYWNLRLFEDPAWRPYGDWEAAFAKWVEGQRFTDPDPALALALGTVLWHNEREAAAEGLWANTLQAHPDAAAQTALPAILAIAKGEPTQSPP